LSVGTTRLLKAILPSACLWTGLRDVEGFGFERTQKELNTMFAAADDMDEDDGGAAGAGIPEAIASMLGDKEAVEALGSMIWYDRAVRLKVPIFDTEMTAQVLAHAEHRPRYYQHAQLQYIRSDEQGRGASARRADARTH
jgi:hypothetical protein